MKIKQALFTAGNSSFYFDDQQAIKDGAGHDGFVYTGKPVTPGFTAVRQAGECVSVQLILENGSVAMGDCAAVQYSGAGGRDPLFLAENFIPFLEKHIKPLLEGRDVSEFRNNAKFFDELKVEGKQLHTAIRYGLSQALLDATALASNRLKAEVVCDEWHLPVVAEPIPLFGQSGDDRYNAVDKMILKHVDVLPHGLINNVDEKLGRQGEKLRAYVEWLAKRIVELRTEDTYKPSLHIDVYGTIGLIFDKDPIRCAEYIASLQEQAGDLELYIEGPVDAGNKPDQIRLMKGIMDHLKKLGSKVK
ncbi:MAG: methylaspartate ammonia-lyase, partial [Morganella morganii]